MKGRSKALRDQKMENDSRDKRRHRILSKSLAHSTVTERSKRQNGTEVTLKEMMATFFSRIVETYQSTDSIITNKNQR